MKLWAETPRSKMGWCMGSTMMAGASKKHFNTKLLITEIRDGEDRNVRILHKLSSVFNKMVEEDEDIELSTEEYGLKIVKTVRQENYNNEMWDQWVVFSRKIYDNLEQILKGK